MSTQAKAPTVETVFLPQGGVLVVREFFLDVTEGPDAAKSFGPLAPPFSVGSSKSNDVVLSDSAVSSFHFRVVRSNEGAVVIDSGSTNGTFMGTVRVREAFLQEDVPIRIGKTALRVRTSGESKRLEMSTRTRFGNLVGESARMRALFALLERLAKADAPVLIEGETGTGKELVARALHAEGPKKDMPFVVVDCGAAAPTLIESELFGHTKGAFTGAESPRTGAFELADGGTLFLDEIGELPLSLQPKLLRALETKTVKPLGAAQERSVTVRVVAATHRNLRQMVNSGTFREDLYFRLAVCPVEVPPLRERLQDMAILTKNFLSGAMKAMSEAPVEVPSLTPETLHILRAQPWPGNVRELRNLVERAVILGDEEATRQGDLASALREIGAVLRRSEPESLEIEEAKRRFEREYLVKLLQKHENDHKAAAEEAGVHPKSLQRLIRRHGLRR